MLSKKDFFHMPKNHHSFIELNTQFFSWNCTLIIACRKEIPASLRLNDHLIYFKQNTHVIWIDYKA